MVVHLGDWFSSHNFANMIPLNRSFYTQITPILNCCCSVDKFTRYRCFNASNKVVLSYWKAKGHIASASNQMFNWNFAKWFPIYFQADTLTRYSDTSSFLVYFIHFSFRRSTRIQSCSDRYKLIASIFFTIKIAFSQVSGESSNS